MQWLTVDGQNVPIVLPDHWDDDKKEWKTTGTGNPLPIANYTQNASGVWLPTSESNPMPTQPTGGIVEVHEIFVGEVIPAQSTVNYYITFKGSQIGINGRLDSGSGQPTVSYAYNRYDRHTFLAISDVTNLSVSGIYIGTTDSKRIGLTSPTVRFNINNTSDEQVTIRHMYITEYY